MSARQILSRRFRIVVELYRAPHGLTSVRLAERVGASRPTVDRDLQFLRTDVGLPVERTRRTGEVWHQLRDLPLASVTATPLQVTALRLARRALDNLDGTSFVSALDQVLAALPQTEPRPPTLDVAWRSTGVRPDIVRRLDAAIAAGQRVRLQYRAVTHGGQVREYLVDAVTLRYAAGDLYLLGWAVNRSAARTFKVRRIVEAITLDEPADRHPELQGEERFRDAVKAWTGDPQRVRVRLAPSVAWLVGEYPLVEDQQVIECEDGAVIVEATVSGITETSRWILGWGGDAEALDPPGLRRMVAQELREASQRYGPDPAQHG